MPKNMYCKCLPHVLSWWKKVDHLFLNCRVAWFLWKSVFSWFDVSGVLPFSLVHLFEAWNMGAGSCRGCTMWESSFVATLRVIWKERNNRCYQVTNVALLRDKIKHLVAYWVSPFDSFQSLPTVLRNSFRFGPQIEIIRPIRDFSESFRIYISEKYKN